MGALLAAGESRATKAINFDEPEGDANKAYTGFIQLAVPYQLRYYNVEDSPEIDYSIYTPNYELFRALLVVEGCLTVALSIVTIRVIRRKEVYWHL